MDRTLKVLGIAVVVAVVGFVLFDHLTDPGKRESASGLFQGLAGLDEPPQTLVRPDFTPEEKQATIEASVADPDQATYDTQVWIFAQQQLENILNQEAVIAGSAPLQDTLTYMVYLAEGSEAGEYEFCDVVYPIVAPSHSLLDPYFAVDLPTQTTDLIGRWNKVVNEQAARGACLNEAQPAQQVST